MFLVKDFETLFKSMINTPDMIDVHNKYFFCIDKNIVFIKRSRKYYKVMATACCGFEPTFRESVFDCVYYSEDLEQSVEMFRSYVMRLLCRV